MKFYFEIDEAGLKTSWGWGYRKLEEGLEFFSSYTRITVS